VNPHDTDLLAANGLRIEVGARVLIDAGDLRIRRGESWCLLGPNGSGKSTLLHILTGLRAPQRGTVLLEGQTYRGLGLREAARLRGLLLQQQVDTFSATVREVVMLGRHPHIGSLRGASAEDRASVEQALKQLDLVGIAEQDILTLSGGERQRVALATLLAQAPMLYLLDEPTAHLDFTHQAMLFRALSALTQSGCAVIFATHDCNLAKRFATHSLLLSGGGVMHAGEAHTLLDAERLSTVFGYPLDQIGDGARGAFVPRW